ncbi:MAG: hypothetical protein KAI39_10685, partial [Desulfobulbaceae bacterium]|nr:hypothetical protein [Desulfobulbaceae bacterium]
LTFLMNSIFLYFMDDKLVKNTKIYLITTNLQLIKKSRISVGLASGQKSLDLFLKIVTQNYRSFISRC